MDKKIKLFLGTDHAGFLAKEEIKLILEKNKIDFEDLGTDNENISVDYPDYAKTVAKKVLENKNNFGILICGSGTGMQICANKVKGIRAVFSYDIYSAKMGRVDNDANILTLRSREFDHNKYEEIILSFLESKFSENLRHKNRINKLEN